MKAIMKSAVSMTVIIILMAGLMQCGSSNRLREYEFRNTTAAALMAAPPRAMVFSDEAPANRGRGILDTAIRLGTQIAKNVEMRNAQKKLDAAMQKVDVPEHIRAETLHACADHLYFKPVDRPTDADFLFRMEIHKYGIVAESWDAEVYFKLDVGVQLIDNQRHVEVWKKSIHENLPVSRSMFGLGQAGGSILTAMQLSDMTEEEMIAGFTHLADYLSGRIAERIHEDYIEAHTAEPE